MRPAFIRMVTTAACTRSPRNFGKMRPREGSPTWWPARPMRWRPLATDDGDSTWTTRSIAPMSMPSSRLDVATRAGRRPLFRRSSISRRCSRAMDPWWARTSSAPASSLRRAAMRSASRREFTKTSVEVWARIRSSSRGYIAGQIECRASGSPAAGPDSTSSGRGRPSSAMSSTGTTTSRSSCLRTPASTTVTGRGWGPSRPPRKRATSSCGRWVAERPMRWGAGRPPRRTRWSRRSRERARWAPRLVAATPWISSTMTTSAVASVSRADDVSMRYSDSGVVTRTSGGWRTRSRRSAPGVSPVRAATRTGGRLRPRRSPSRAMPVSGPRRLRSTS
jgi:hypothetical protein